MALRVARDALIGRPVPLKVTSFYFLAGPISGRRAKSNKRRTFC